MVERDRHRDLRFAVPAAALFGVPDDGRARDRAHARDPPRRGRFARQQHPDPLAEVGEALLFGLHLRAARSARVEVVESAGSPPPAAWSSPVAPLFSEFRGFARFRGSRRLCAVRAFFDSSFSACSLRVFRFRSSCLPRPVRCLLQPAGRRSRGSRRVAGPGRATTFSAVTRWALGAKTIRPSSTRPVSLRPSACCQRRTAAAVASL